MALGADELAQVAALVNEMINTKAPIGRDGMIVPGSYNAQNATVDVMLTDTAVVFPGDPTQQPMIERNVPLATNHIDDAHGPFGGELVHLKPTQSGYTADIYRQPDGSEGPQTPQGERWILLRNPNGVVVASIKLTQNGATSSDGLGGLSLLVGSLLSIISASGWTVKLDDNANVFSIQAPGTNGLYFAMNAATSKVLIGATGLGVADELVTKTDFQNYINANEAAFNAHIHSGVSTGAGVSGVPTVAMNITATGSSTVEGKE